MITDEKLKENKALYINLLKTYVHRDGIDKLISYIETSDFFDAPASVKFHGAYKGGLCEHSLGVYLSLKGELQLLGITDYSDETVAIVALLHDVCKINTYKIEVKNRKNEQGSWESYEAYTFDDSDFPTGHSEKSIFRLMQFISLTKEEIMVINAHMGGFDSRAKDFGNVIGKTFDHSKLAVLLHTADMWSCYVPEVNAKF